MESSVISISQTNNNGKFHTSSTVKIELQARTGSQDSCKERLSTFGHVICDFQSVTEQSEFPEETEPVVGCRAQRRGRQLLRGFKVRMLLQRAGEH